MTDHPPTPPATERPSQAALRRYAALVSLSTLALIFIGGMVTSTNSGMSVPDWPTTYGYSMFGFPVSKWVGGVFYEHGHRLVASAVGFMTLVLALWLPLVEKRVWVRLLGFAALSAIVLQGLLGGMTVLLGLSKRVSLLHGVLAQTFFVLTVMIAYALSRERRARVQEDEPRSTSVSRRAVWLLAAVYIQLILGAAMRHSNAGLAIPDFPTIGGRWLPWFDASMLDAINAMRAEIGHQAATQGQVVIHFAHRMGALLVTVAAAALSIAVFRPRAASRRLVRTAIGFDMLLIAQIALAAATIWTHKAPVVASLHVAVGAGLLGFATLLALRAFPVRQAEGARTAPAGADAPVAGLGAPSGAVAS
jgi:heme a synthase